MSTKSIQWLQKSVLQTNVEYSRYLYDSLEDDFSVCTHYVELDEKHFPVYSFGLADLIIRIGPEILRLFNLILFNQRRENEFSTHPELEKEMKNIQQMKEARRDDFPDYLNAFSMTHHPLTQISVRIKTLEKSIVPFETQKRRIQSGKDIDVVPWWVDGYNGLRHRVIEEFSTSATLKHALFSLAGLWVLHSLLDYDIGMLVMRKSDYFDIPSFSS